MDFIQEPFDDWFHRTTDELSRRTQRSSDDIEDVNFGFEELGAQETPHAPSADAAPADGPIRASRAEKPLTAPKPSVTVSASKPRTRAKIDRLLRAISSHPRDFVASDDRING